MLLRVCWILKAPTRSPYRLHGCFKMTVCHCFPSLPEPIVSLSLRFLHVCVLSRCFGCFAFTERLPERHNPSDREPSCGLWAVTSQLTCTLDPWSTRTPLFSFCLSMDDTVLLWNWQNVSDKYQLAVFTSQQKRYIITKQACGHFITVPGFHN